MTQRTASTVLGVTSWSAVNALGATTSEVVSALEAGRSGLGPCPFELPFTTVVGAVPGDLPPMPAALSRWESRVARIALLALDGLSAAVDRAVRRWGRERIAVLVGTSTGGILETERAMRAAGPAAALPAGYDFDRQHAFHGLLDVVRARTGAAGPAWVVSTACSSSAKVLGSARRLVEAGIVDAAVVGGADSLCDTTLRGFGALEALSARPCRPFSAGRDGTNIGEGGAFMLVERGAEGPVRLLGIGESGDAHHMSHPHPEGVGARLAMERALAQAGIAAAGVDHVNAHGTATVANDVVEAKAIREVLGTAVPVASTKGYTGHLLGAAGMTEAVFAAIALERGFIPASLGADPLDPAVELDVVREGRRARLRTVLSNSFAFGGSNASVLLGGA